MDHLRIFIDSTFYQASRYLLEKVDNNDFSVITEKQFLACARTSAPSLSDDALRLIHRLSKDNWNHNDSQNDNHNSLQLPAGSSIFRAIFEIAERLLISDRTTLKVRFQHLFKWRDVTRLIGEDLLVTAYLAKEDAFSYRKSDKIAERLTYPSSLHNDNPDIEWLMNHGNLHELHSHLNASASVFNINWVCLMNNPQGRSDQIKRFLKTLDDVENETKAIRVAELIIKCSLFRFFAYRYLKGELDETRFSSELEKLLYSKGEKEGKEHRDELISYRCANNLKGLDYILHPETPSHCTGDFSVYLGERYFLYLGMLHLIRKDDRAFVSAFRFYLLVKSIIRSYMIQLNSNHGFANFKRFQDVKGLFVEKYPKYNRLLRSLAISDAWRDSNIAYQEVRIAPKNSLKQLYKGYKSTISDIDSELQKTAEEIGTGNIPGYGIIYHFIKVPEKNFNISGGVDFCRNYNVRRELRRKSYSIRYLFRNIPKERNFIKGIDAAASEFNCRPEVFGQAFRFLKNAGLKITFHAGEDFYDLADGLRSIDEAVTFLGMESGDRIGHAIAMGRDAREYYTLCENHIIVPAQWMLDNVVWLLFRSADWNISLEPATESFLRSQFHILYSMIYNGSGNEIPNCNEHEYFQSLLLRGDTPDWYGMRVKNNEATSYSDSWESFELLDSHRARLARNNPKIRLLYQRYHFDKDVKKRGAQVIEFKVCEGYFRLIEAMQERMMHRLERKHIAIECCPSSNLLIGSLMKFRKHPAFRFYSVKGDTKHHHLKVTLNTDDLGVFQTSLANEYSYMALALAKEKDEKGRPLYMPYDINQWLSSIAANGEKCRF